MRQNIQSNPIPIAIAAAAVLLVVIALVVRSRVSKPTVPGLTGHWYYDIQSKQLFVEPERDLPLAVPPSNAMLVGVVPGGLRAHVFSCGDCNNESERQILYVESYAPVRDAQELGVPSDGTPNAVFIIAKFEPPFRWVRSDSLDGLAIRNSAEKLCGGKPATECLPPAP